MGGLASLIMDLNRKGYEIIFKPDINPENTLITLVREYYGRTYVQNYLVTKYSIEYFNVDINTLIYDIITKMRYQLEKYIESEGFTRITLYEKRGDSE